MICGEAIEVTDPYGGVAFRFIAQCEGRFLLISHTYDRLNGYVLADWRGVLRQLVAATVPAAMTEATRRARSTATGLYVDIPLTYPLSCKGLAELIGVYQDDVREQLADLAVTMDP